MSTQTLCVIDMQTYFSESAAKCLDAVVEEVKRFVKENQPILIVEYWDRHTWIDKVSNTYKEILDAVKGYKYVDFVRKYYDAGGSEIAEVATMNHFPLDNLRMVGVNRSACIARTVRELKEMYGEECHIEVSAKASADSWLSEEYAIERLQEMGAEWVD